MRVNLQLKDASKWSVDEMVKAGNRKEGMGLGHAAACLSSWWKDLKRCFPEVQGTFWDDEIKRITTLMRKRARLKENERSIWT